MNLLQKQTKQIIQKKSQSIGWGLLSFSSQQYTPSPNEWYFLSPEETMVIQNVLKKFYEIPEEKQEKQTLQKTLIQYCYHYHILLESQQKQYLQKVLHQHAFQAGPLTPLLNDNQIEEIAINGIGKKFPVHIYLTQKGWKETGLYFTSSKQLITLLNRMAIQSGKRLSTRTPTLNAFITGKNRLHASISPVCTQGVEATIRKFVFRPCHPEELCQTNVITPIAMAFLVMAIQCDSNILIAGNTGSGKTTTLNALAGSIHPKERIIVVEETPELLITNPHCVLLTVSDNESQGIQSIIRETLRMRPDRVIIGEIRKPEEAQAFMEAILAGQGKGTYATFHGHSVEETLSRMKQLGVPETDLSWLNLIVVQKRWTTFTPNGFPVDQRAICEIAEIIPNENGYSKRTIFEINPQTKQLFQKNKSILIKEKFSWNFPEKEFQKTIQEMEEKYQKGMIL